MWSRYWNVSLPPLHLGLWTCSTPLLSFLEILGKIPFGMECPLSAQVGNACHPDYLLSLHVMLTQPTAVRSCLASGDFW